MLIRFWFGSYVRKEVGINYPCHDTRFSSFTLYITWGVENTIELVYFIFIYLASERGKETEFISEFSFSENLINSVIHVNWWEGFLNFRRKDITNWSWCCSAFTSGHCTSSSFRSAWCQVRWRGVSLSHSSIFNFYTLYKFDGLFLKETT